MPLEVMIAGVCSSPERLVTWSGQMVDVTCSPPASLRSSFGNRSHGRRVGRPEGHLGRGRRPRRTPDPGRKSWIRQRVPSAADRRRRQTPRDTTARVAAVPGRYRHASYAVEW